MFVSDHIIKSLADDFARERRAEAGARRRPRGTSGALRGKLTRVRKNRASAPAAVPAEKTIYS